MHLSGHVGWDDGGGAVVSSARRVCRAGARGLSGAVVAAGAAGRGCGGGRGEHHRSNTTASGECSRTLADEQGGGGGGVGRSATAAALSRSHRLHLGYRPAQCVVVLGRAGAVRVRARERRQHAARSEAASSSARDDESCWMMRHVLPTVLRHARPLPPIRDDGTAGESLWSPGDVMDGDEELLVENSAQPVSSADAYALLVAVYSAWRESPLDTSSSLLAGSPWSPTPSPDWLEWLLSRDTLWLRWWALPAVAAAAAATDAIDDAMLRETDRRTYERRLALALAQVQLCREWLVVVAAPPLQISEYGRDGSGGADAAKEGGRESEVRAPDTLMIPRPTSNASRALPHVLLADGGAVSALHDAFGGRCLEPTEQRDVLQRVLHDDPTLLHRANIRGVQLVTLLERHPVEFVSALTRHLLATSTSRAEEYLQALAQLPVSVTSLSLVHAVHRRDLFRHFVSHACARLTPRPLDHTAARQEQLLAALVLRALEEEEEAQQHQRTGEHTVSVSSVISKELGAELRTWALRASRLHTVARLYRALARYAQSPP
eukprot:ctg_708.g352